jgi:nucleoside-diphosphate-sugar epimerase
MQSRVSDTTLPPIRCAITGSSGYLGSKLADYIERSGATAIRLSSNGSPDCISFSLDRGVPAGSFESNNIDALIHCAWDFSLTRETEIFERNVEGSIKLFRQAKREGVRRLIFISSMSAFEDCKSFYGKAKLAVEAEIAAMGGSSIRPGLIYSANACGMVGSLVKAIDISPLIPLIGSGKYVLYLVHEEDLCALVASMLVPGAQLPAKPLIAASEEGHSFKDILRGFAAIRGRSIRFLPVPWRLIATGLKATEGMKFKLPFRSDSVLSLVNQNGDPDFSETRKAGVSFRRFSQYVEENRSARS